MTASEFYQRAKDNGMTYEANCTEVSIAEWDQLMKGAVKANPAKIEKLIKEQYHELYCNFCLDIPNCYNPHRSSSVRTDMYIIYIHSAIEYFFKVN